jgi:hypothetical protein
MAASFVRRITAVALAACSFLAAQQLSDPDFDPAIQNPAYAEGKGPVVAIDEAHNNFHTAGGRYKPFADLVGRDGYAVRGFDTPFTAESLQGVEILVVSNALNERNREDWSLPTPSAFTGNEIQAVRDWVSAGGALLLIADHMPFPGAAEKMGAAFGLHFSNGMVGQGPLRAATIKFNRPGGGLADHIVTRGRDASEGVEFVVTFGGSGFQAPRNAQPVLVLDKTAISFTPERAGDFGPTSPQEPVGGWLQGATLQVGKGRLAVFGEAAMFSAQVAGNNRFGMNSPNAPHNAQLLLNVMHWLSGLLPD